jgi:quercetin dioxygenase-like cupin family protein
MPYFYDPETRTRKELLPGVATRTFWGDRMLMSLVDFQPGAIIPPHSHPHEQAGMLLSGEVRLTIAGETRPVKPGDIYIVPGGSEHSLVVGDRVAQCLEVFTPVREEYKFPD